MRIIYSILFCLVAQAAIAKAPDVRVYNEEQELTFAIVYLYQLTPGFGAAAVGDYEAEAKKSLAKGTEAVEKAIRAAQVGNRKEALSSAEIASASLKRTAILIPYETVAAAKASKVQLDLSTDAIDRARFILGQEKDRALSLHAYYPDPLPEASVKGNIVFHSTNQCLPDYQFARVLSYDLRKGSDEGFSWSFRGVFYCTDEN